MRRRLSAVALRLGKVYGAPPAARRLPPLDELILTVLSQHTSDTNRDRAYADLRSRFPSWDEVAGAPLPALAKAIYRGGLGPTSGAHPRILETSRPRDRARRARALGMRSRTAVGSARFPFRGRTETSCMRAALLARRVRSSPVVHARVIASRAVSVLLTTCRRRRGAGGAPGECPAAGDVRAPHAPDSARARGVRRAPSALLAVRAVVALPADRGHRRALS